jgi:uncharacterized repeat protein (TIGR03803 family)
MQDKKQHFPSILALAVLALTLSLAVCAQAQTTNFIGEFDGTNGWEPYGSVTQATDGNFYGTATGGVNGGGNIFRMTPSGEISNLYTFCSSNSSCPDGGFPQTAPILGTDGNMYGVTYVGGSGSSGVFYRLTTGGEYTILYNFCANFPCDNEGLDPVSIILASDGNFYGITNYGGTGGAGTIFKITPTGQYTQLYSFCSLKNCTDGGPAFYPLVQGNDGNFYGTAYQGGSMGGGVIWELTASGTYRDIGYGTVFQFSNGLSPLVETVPVAGPIGRGVIILGNGLTGSASVTFNGKEADFTVVSDTEITATVPHGAATGTVSVVTPSGALNSNPQFVVTK